MDPNKIHRIRLALWFAIAGDLRYLSHRDTMRAWQRVFVRAQMPLRYSQGFNPHLRFSLPLPRPALLLHEPRPVQLEPRLGAPERVQLEGRWLPVRHSWGPELLCVEWWAAGIDRRYWVLELADGRGLWVYCELGHAFLHGFFDQGSPAPAAAGGGGW